VLYLTSCTMDVRRVREHARCAGGSVARDPGYAIHCVMRALWQDKALCPWTYHIDGQSIHVSGYGATRLIDLAARAASAESSARAVVQWIRIGQVIVRDTWRVGEVVPFRLVACPVVRMSSDGPHWRRKAELDAYQAACLVAEPGHRPEREDVYLSWLRGHVERRGGAGLADARLVSHSRDYHVRRDHGRERKASRLRFTTAVLEGRMAVTEQAAFVTLLSAGIGRHKAFGFGMLQLTGEPWA
jgi:CRISPR system Cascade subunit CasE